LKKLLITLCLLLCVSDAVLARHRHRVSRPVIPPAFTTQSFLVADNEGNIIKEHDSDLVRPIASISKLMVSLLASEQDLTESLDIPKKRTVQSHIPFRLLTLTREELLTLALVKSDNFAAQILCNNLPDCIERMNEKAQELGMIDTHYFEPTGLSRENVSTARDLLKLMLVSADNPVISNLSKMPIAYISTGKRKFRINNTNPLTSKMDVFLSKTGFTRPAGGCIVMGVNSPIGQRFFILLGSRNSHTRIPEVERLYDEVQFDAYRLH